MNKKTAREIIIEEKLIDNKNINVRVGTAENRSCPETIYTYISFWVKPNSETIRGEARNKLSKKIKNIYNHSIKRELKNNEFFLDKEDNIYIMNIPDNFNYNGKPNFISLELYLHTCNIGSENKIPLSNKRNKSMFNEIIKITNIMGQEISELEKCGFELFKKNVKENKSENRKAIIQCEGVEFELTAADFKK